MREGGREAGREGGREGGRNKYGQERERRTSGQRIIVGRRGDEDRRTCEGNEGGMEGGWGEEEKGEERGWMSNRRAEKGEERGMWGDGKERRNKREGKG